MDANEIIEAVKNIKLTEKDKAIIKNLKDDEFFILKYQRWDYEDGIIYIEMHIMLNDGTVMAWHEPWLDFVRINNM